MTLRHPKSIRADSDTRLHMRTAQPSVSTARHLVNVQAHQRLKSHIWEIANRLRGPYRPPQYRLVMLPIVVLRRLNFVLEPTKDAVLKKYEAA